MAASKVRMQESLLEEMRRGAPLRPQKISMPLVMPFSWLVARTLQQNVKGLE